MPKNDCPLEKDEQKTVIQFLDWNYPGAYKHHSANEGKRKPQYLLELMLMGMRKGHPDIEILEPRDKYHGLFIEMKRRKGGRVSDDQQKCIDELNERGYRAVVCKGAEEAIKVIKEYLGGELNG